ncbi:mitochondrial 54S ribosomal protein uL3m [Lipomyces oligophaga]|uniref:mitochondrial 54S ribosomal protein uL3m n=1 Tax=Lipomyces oligophaga TaxID=45792 RepID=UPI0034CFA72A
MDLFRIAIRPSLGLRFLGSSMRVRTVTSTADAVSTPISSSIKILPADPNRPRLEKWELPLPKLFNSLDSAMSRKKLSSRTGVLALKVGMLTYYDDEGFAIPVTMLLVDRVQVTNCRTKDVGGFYSVQVGAGARNARNIPSAELGHLARKGIPPKAKLTEFLVKNEDGLLPIGTEIRASHFKEGQYVDIWGTSKGKGFSGVMKRWGFKGLRASHGTTLKHRSGGSIGANQDPGRVLPGKKMAGRMGGKSSTTQNALVIKVFPDEGLILIKGPVPGPKNAYVALQDAIGKPAL